MKQFDIEKYLENPKQRVVTRDGRNVRIICTDRRADDDHRPIVSLVEDHNSEVLVLLYEDGTHSDANDDLDLFFAPKKHEGWINLYQMDYGVYANSDVYPTKEEAERYGKFSSHASYVDTCKIEWEE